MEKEIKLTIGIPVYNGEKFISNAINSILNQINDRNKKRVEIVISDNASTDKTFEIVKEYQEKHESIIKCYKNKTNLGYDKNIDLLVEYATGEYVWFLGCQEVLKDGSIDRILRETDKDKYDNILLNFDIYSEVLNGIEDINAMKSTEDIVYTSKEQFFIDRNGPALAVSANIVLKESWSSISDNALIENGWCHLERLIDVIASKNYKKSLFVAAICFTLYRESNGWWTTRKVFLNFINYVKILNKKMEYEFSPQLRRVMFKRQSGLAFLHSIVLGKRAGLIFTRDIFWETIKIFHKSVWLWLIGILLMCVPNFVYKNEIIKNTAIGFMKILSSIKRGIKYVKSK